MRRRVTRPGPPSSRLVGLIEGDLVGHRREAGEGRRARFVPVGGGPALEVASRIEKRFLGRTEIAVFVMSLDVSLPEDSVIVLRHTGGFKRTGLTAAMETGGAPGRQMADALASDQELKETLMPLDFTRFQVFCGPAGCRLEVELMGASHVAMALPPLRSYVHLYPDQRDALMKALAEVRRVVLGSA